ncbi:MAG: DUF481 domain-containing protein [Elusimicrobiota bacterium]
MRRITLYTILICFTASGLLKGAEWDLSGVAGANYSQTAVNDNWSGGETNSRDWSFKSDGAAERETEKTSWLNSLKFEFGKTSVDNGPEQESSDLIYYNSIYKYKHNLYVNPYISFNTDTQFTDFFDPVTLTESAGIGWNIISGESQNLRTRVGAALKQSIVSKKETYRETGGEWISNYDLNLNEHVKLVSELKMFTAFDAKTDTRWDTSLYFKLGKYLTAQTGYLLINNKQPGKDFSDTVETKLTFGLGFSYNLF